MKCPWCATELGWNFKFCIQCGRKLPDPQAGGVASPAAKPPAAQGAPWDLREAEAQWRAGTDCDQIPGAVGEFGTPGNPIPVYGPLGEVQYLTKLRSESGRPLMFHRLGSEPFGRGPQRLDVYEIVAADGTDWGHLHFDMHHPRDSRLAPPRLSMNHGGTGLGRLGRWGYGLNRLVEDFPHGLPDALREDRSAGDPWQGDRASAVQRWLHETDFRTIAARTRTSRRGVAPPICLGRLDPQEAAMFQRLKISEMYGIEGADWVPNGTKLTVDGIMVWEITLAGGASRTVRFDLQEARRPQRTGGSVTLESLLSILEQTTANTHGRRARGLGNVDVDPGPTGPSASPHAGNSPSPS